MKTIEIHTQGGIKHQVQTEVYDAETLNTKLNDNDLITVLIGDFIIQRIDVKRIIPLSVSNVEGTKKVEVHTNGGKVIEITTNDYDPIYLNEQLNNSNTITVVIGDYIFSRIDVKQIVPVKEEPKEPEQPIEESGEETTEKQVEPTEQL
ncbi:hypothetical protein QJ529_18135 [Bacillus paranthracis]|uniref:hypothetical protein n=1 Tax=Bacillus TaxID=1386 RepID=UPI000CCC58C9|nr:MULTISPECIES: hypothetical protein [Bacillus]MDO3374588.1 hypothetical protein [Bacillus paranthracis]PNS32776.1 hypothetical protein C1640_09630 [Bacillus sp. AKBS9]